MEIEIPEQDDGVVEEPCKKEVVGGEEGAAAGGGESKESGGGGVTRKTRLLEAIRLPLASVFPRKSKASKVSTMPNSFFILVILFYKMIFSVVFDFPIRLIFCKKLVSRSLNLAKANKTKKKKK